MDDIIRFVGTNVLGLAPVFRSESQARLLAAVLLASEEYSLTDLAKAADVPYATTHREVGRLLMAGIFRERTVGKTRLISANEASPLTEPLRQIVAVVEGPATYLKEEFRALRGIRSAFIFGSFAARLAGVDGPVPADVDVMVVGDADPTQVYAAADRVQDLVGRPVNVSLLSEEEIEGDSGFLRQLRSSPAIAVVGDLPW